MGSLGEDKSVRGPGHAVGVCVCPQASLTGILEKGQEGVLVMTECEYMCVSMDVRVCVYVCEHKFQGVGEESCPHW